MEVMIDKIKELIAEAEAFKAQTKEEVEKLGAGEILLTSMEVPGSFVYRIIKNWCCESIVKMQKPHPIGEA